MQLATFLGSLKSWIWDLKWVIKLIKIWVKIGGWGGGGFGTKLLELYSSISLFWMLLLFMYWLNVLLFKVPNGHNSVLHLRQKQGSSFPLRYW